MPNVKIEMEEDPWRGTGRSTRLAIAFVKDAISNAGTWIHIRDHYNAQIAHKTLTKRVRQILDVLDVDYEDRVMSIKVLPMKEKKQ